MAKRKGNKGKKPKVQAPNSKSGKTAKQPKAGAEGLEQSEASGGTEGLAVKYLFPAGIFLFAMVVIGTLSLFGVDVHHDGMLFKPAVDVANGQTLYKDTFTQYGALTTLLQAFAIVLFGKSLVVLKLLTALFWGFNSTLLYLIWSKILPRTGAFCAALITVLVGPYFLRTLLPWSSVYGLFFTLLGTLTLLQMVEVKAKAKANGRKKWLYIATTGACAALAFWCRQPLGLFLPAFGTALLVPHLPKITERVHWMEAIKEIATLAAGFVAVSALFLAWILANGAFDFWIEQSFKMATMIPKIFPGSILSTLTMVSIPTTMETRALWMALPLFNLTALAYACFSLFSGSGFDRRQHYVLIISLVCLFSWHQYFPVNDHRHVFYAAAPMIGVAAYVLYGLHRYFRTSFATVSIALFAVVILGFEIPRRVSKAAALISAGIPLEHPKVLKGMRVSDAEEHQELTELGTLLEGLVKTKPELAMINFTLDAFYPTIMKNTQNSHRHHIYWKDAVDALYPDYFESTDLFIKEERPVLILVPGGKIAGLKNYKKVGEYKNLEVEVLIPVELN